MSWNEGRNYIKENGIELGDEFIFTEPKFGEEIYRLVLFDGDDTYFYTERSVAVQEGYNTGKYIDTSWLKPFHMSSQYADSCMKFDREEEIDKLLTD